LLNRDIQLAKFPTAYESSEKASISYVEETLASRVRDACEAVDVYPEMGSIPSPKQAREAMSETLLVQLIEYLSKYLI
jgi:hypothetical protein